MKNRKENRTQSKVCGCVVHFLGQDVVSITKCGTHQRRHTPTPWQADKCVKRQGYTIAQTATREHPATLVNIAQVVDGSESEANAAFIVRAVNAHEELVIRLRTLIASIESIDSNIDHHQDAFGGSTHSIVRMIRNDIAIAKETIAKAEGK